MITFRNIFSNKPFKMVCYFFARRFFPCFFAFFLGNFSSQYVPFFSKENGDVHKNVINNTEMEYAVQDDVFHEGRPQEQNIEDRSVLGKIKSVGRAELQILFFPSGSEKDEGILKTIQVNDSTSVVWQFPDPDTLKEDSLFRGSIQLKEEKKKISDLKLNDKVIVFFEWNNEDFAKKIIILTPLT